MKKKQTKIQKITSLILFSFLILATTPIILVSYVSLKTAENLLIEHEIQQFQTEGENSATIVQQRINSQIQKLRLLINTDAIQEFKELSQDEITDEMLNEIEEEIKEFAHNVTQLRIIGTDGNELIRLNMENNEKSIVPRDQLQNKADRYYFTETIALRNNQVYISHIDLNREGSPSTIQLPYAPTIRIAIPLNSKDGSNKGIIIANIDSSLLFEDIYNEDNEVEALIDTEGYYLLHVDDSKTYGGPRDLNTGENFKKDFPEIATKFLINNDLTPEETKDTIFIPTLVRTSLDNPDKYWIEISTINKSETINETQGLASNTINTTIISLFIIFAFSIIISKVIGDPLKKLTDEVNIISSGNLDFKVTVPKQEELAGIANAFNRMTTTLKEYRDYLDKKVESRTTKLEALTENMIGRELKMIELKKKINELKKNKNV